MVLFTAIMLGIFAVVLILALAVVVINPPKPEIKAIENPQYDPEIVKFLVSAGVPADEIQITLDQRSLIK